jgi:hydrophobic/amphiphilic exporter-1 (mainly G- bacteria), HAE1 family
LASSDDIAMAAIGAWIRRGPSTRSTRARTRCPSKLKGIGITPQAVATALQTYASGVQASNVVTGGLSYPIYVKVDPTAPGEGQNLLDLPLYSSTLQTSLQVGQLGTFVLNESPVSIVRYNRQYADTFTMNLNQNAPTALEMQKSITAELSRRGLLDSGLSVTSTSRFGQAALASQLGSSGPQIFLLAFFLAYLVMFGGIVFSAVLTFFVVPAAFYRFERKRVGQPSP